MSYQATRYNLLMLYSDRNLLFFRENHHLWSEAVEECLVGVNDLGLSQRSVIYNGRLDINNTRKSRYDYNEGFSKLTGKLEGGETECGLYVYDDCFSQTQLPVFFMNIHVSACGEIAGRKLTHEKTKNAIEAFTLIAIDRDLMGGREFRLFSQTIFSKLYGVRGFCCNDVSYKYDGFTPLEWAFKNHSAKLRFGLLEEWNPEGGIEI